jgi:hypothetical protein
MAPKCPPFAGLYATPWSLRKANGANQDDGQEEGQDADRHQDHHEICSSQTSRGRTRSRRKKGRSHKLFVRQGAGAGGMLRVDSEGALGFGKQHTKGMPP